MPLINLKIASRVISRNLLILGSSLLVCTLVALWFSENLMPFLFTALIALSCGGLLALISARMSTNHPVHKKDTYFTVTLSWLTICLTGSLPYIFSGAITAPVNAVFESVSGFTTTGASILTNIEALPKSILFWRSLTHWIGGIGIIVLVIVVMPSMKMGGYQFFTLESSLQEKIQPRIRAIGLRLLLIYVSLTLAEVVLLLLGRMSLFESLCHAFGTVATGGFSPRNNSIAGYSPYIQYVVMIFMFLAGTNFLVHYYLFKREFARVRQNEELRFYVSVVGIIGLVLTAILYFKMGKPLEASFREAYFQLISIVSCTGFATADYLQWPAYGWMIIFLSMFLGGCTGSTAGGIKMVRHLIFLKNFRKIFRQNLSPHAIVSLRLNNNVLSEETNHSVLMYISIYLMILVAGTLMMVMMGLDIQTAAGSVATCMAGIGPGIGTVGPVSNFAHLPDAAKLVLAFLMIVGRLEIFTVIVLFTRSFWKR